jgi:hypothetical protein
LQIMDDSGPSKSTMGLSVHMPCDGTVVIRDEVPGTQTTQTRGEGGLAVHRTQTTYEKLWVLTAHIIHGGKPAPITPPTPTPVGRH